MLYNMLHGLRGDNITYFGERTCCALPHDRVTAAKHEGKFWKELNEARFKRGMKS